MGQHSTTGVKWIYTDTCSKITNLKPSIGTILPVINLHGQQNALREADQLTLASEGSMHV